MKRSVLAPLLVAAAIGGVAAPAHAASAQPYDSHWLQASIADDRFEIQAAKLAVQRSRNGHLGALAGRLLSDHTKALKEATALARRVGVAVPPRPTAGMVAVLQLLRALSPAGFAKQYATFEIGHHDEAIVEAGMEVKNGESDEVRKFADGTSTMLAKHLRLARTTLRALSARARRGQFCRGSSTRCARAGRASRSARASLFL